MLYDFLLADDEASVSCLDLLLLAVEVIGEGLMHLGQSSNIDVVRGSVRTSGLLLMTANVAFVTHILIVLLQG